MYPTVDPLNLPNAKPRTNREVPRIITSLLTPNSSDVTVVAVLKTDEAKVTEKVIRPATTVINHFLLAGKFWGLSLSSESIVLAGVVFKSSLYSMFRLILPGPSHSTKLGSFFSPSPSSFSSSFSLRLLRLVRSLCISTSASELKFSSLDPAAKPAGWPALSLTFKF
jgi:hypothetical protein